MSGLQFDSADVVVVGGGVSGCACAGMLAEGGADVVLLGQSLDSAGLPGGGPMLYSSRQRSAGPLVAESPAEVLRSLSQGLAHAWLRGALVPGHGAGPGYGLGSGVVRDFDGSATQVSRDRRGSAPDAIVPAMSDFLIVDRRGVSLRTKAWLESLPALRLRQGLAVDLEAAEESVQVKTAFGELIRCRVVVIAVGLALGGRHLIAGSEFDGARMGESPADDLADSLERAGAELDEARAWVGPRLVGQPNAVRLDVGPVGSAEGNHAHTTEGLAGPAAPRPPGAMAQGGTAEWLRDAFLGGGRTVDGVYGVVRLARFSAQDDVDFEDFAGSARRDAGAQGSGSTSTSTSSSAPPAPDEDEHLAKRDAVLVRREAASLVAGLAPDGIATAEWYAAAPDVAKDAIAAGMRVSRPAYESLGRTVRVLADNGSATGLGAVLGLGGRVFAVGTVAGADSYLESLRSAAGVVEAVENVLERRNNRTAGRD